MTCCGHCGQVVAGFAVVADGTPVCHTGTLPPQADPLDCYRLVTVYGEELGSRKAPTHGQQGVCAVCGGMIGYIKEYASTGGGEYEVLNAWWAHAQHPADGHDAVPGAEQSGSRIKEETMPEERHDGLNGYNDPEGTSPPREYSHRGRQQRDLNDRNADNNPDGSDALPLPLPEPRR